MLLLMSTRIEIYNNMLVYRQQKSEKSNIIEQHIDTWAT